MTHGPTRISGKGACIYCGDSQSKLTDEHIVPLSLGGQHVISNASCGKCADITKKFEQDVARELWGDARIAYDAPTRRRKSRPSHIDVRDPVEPEKFLSIPKDEYPAAMVFYTMGIAGILQGKPRDYDRSGQWQFSSIVDDAKLNAFLAKHPDKLTAKFRHVPVSFGRTIIKIGYCHILTQLDPGDFDPICLPYILGDDSNVSHILGSEPTIAPPQVGLGYHLGTAVVGTEDTAFVIAEVRLIANNHTPSYHVVTGSLSGRANIEKIIAKLGPGTMF